MKKFRWICLVLCLILAMQWAALPCVATETEDPSESSEAGAETSESAQSGKTDPEGQDITLPTVSGDASISAGCRTIEGKVPLTNDPTLLKTAKAAFLYERNTGTEKSLRLCSLASIRMREDAHAVRCELRVLHWKVRAPKSTGNTPSKVLESNYLNCLYFSLMFVSNVFINTLIIVKKRSSLHDACSSPREESIRSADQPAAGSDTHTFILAGRHFRLLLSFGYTNGSQFRLSG